MTVLRLLTFLIFSGWLAAGSSQATSLLTSIPDACARYEASASSSEKTPSSTSERLRLGLECADEALASGKPHRASRIAGEVSEVCRDLETNGLESIPEAARARVAAICLLAVAEEMNFAAPWRRFSLARRLRDLRTLASNGKWEPAERLFFDGRLRSALPPGQGQDLKSALVSFHFLQRLEPKSTRAAYWTARAYERQGNPEAAERFSREALAGNPPEPLEVARQKLSPREFSDAPGFGLTPFLFVTPARGYGAGLVWFDDRLFDTDRAATVDLRWATRAGPLVRAEMTDPTGFAGLGVEGNFLFGDGDQDFFGFGIGPDGNAPLSVQRLEGSLRLVAPLGFSSRFALGWRYAAAHGEGTALSFGAQMGPTAELVYDSRDSAREPRRGNLFSVGGFFPTESLGSGRTFEEWAWRAEHHEALGLRHTVSLALGGTHVRGSAPTSAYPRTGWPWRFAGVRENRFTDRNLAAGVLEYRWRSWSTSSLIAFATVVAASPDGGRLLSDPLAAGGGLGWLGHFRRARSATPRFELSLIKGELNLQAALLASF